MYGSSDWIKALIERSELREDVNYDPKTFVERFIAGAPANRFACLRAGENSFSGRSPGERFDESHLRSLERL